MFGLCCGFECFFVFLGVVCVSRGEVLLVLREACAAVCQAWSVLWLSIVYTFLFGKGGRSRAKSM